MSQQDAINKSNSQQFAAISASLADLAKAVSGLGASQTAPPNPSQPKPQLAADFKGLPVTSALDPFTAVDLRVGEVLGGNLAIFDLVPGAARDGSPLRDFDPLQARLVQRQAAGDCKPASAQYEAEWKTLRHSIAYQLRFIQFTGDLRHLLQQLVNEDGDASRFKSLVTTSLLVPQLEQLESVQLEVVSRCLQRSSVVSTFAFGSDGEARRVVDSLEPLDWPGTSNEVTLLIRDLRKKERETRERHSEPASASAHRSPYQARTTWQPRGAPVPATTKRPAQPAKPAWTAPPK